MRASATTNPAAVSSPRPSPALAGALWQVAAAPATSRLITFVFAVGVLVNLALAESLRTFPLEDMTNNLTRYVMLDRAWLHGSGALPPYLDVRFVVGPYLGVDLIGASLVHVLGPSATERVIAAMVVCAVPIGMWALLYAVGSASSVWSLVGVLLGMGFFTLVGFINYVIGLGAALLWLAAWWPSRAAPSRSRAIGLGLGIAALYLFHLSAPLIVLVVVWVDTAAAPLPSLREIGHETTPGAAVGAGAMRRWVHSAVHDRRFQFAVGLTLILAVMAVLGGVGAAAPGRHQASLDYPPLRQKLMNVFTPFYVFSIEQAAITIAVYAILAATFLWLNRRALMRHRYSTWLLSAAAFLALFFVFPAGTPGTGYLDMRWLPPVFLFPFAAAEAEGVRPARFVAVLALAGCLVHDAVLTPSLRAIEQELTNYRVILDELPPQSRVLPLIADGDRHGLRIFPYRHFAFWHVIDRGGRVPGLFNGAGEGGGRPRHSFLSHFVERDHPYEPGERWSRDGYPPLDWSQIERDYDYIVEAGADRRATRMIGAHATELTRVGDVALFEVRPGG